MTGFKISGELHHLTGALLPEGWSKPPKYAQLYLYDSAEEQVNYRMNNNQTCDRFVMSELQSNVESNSSSHWPV